MRTKNLNSRCRLRQVSIRPDWTCNKFSRFTLSRGTVFPIPSPDPAPLPCPSPPDIVTAQGLGTDANRSVHHPNRSPKSNPSFQSSDFQRRSGTEITKWDRHYEVGQTLLGRLKPRRTNVDFVSCKPTISSVNLSCVPSEFCQERACL